VDTTSIDALYRLYDANITNSLPLVASLLTVAATLLNKHLNKGKYTTSSDEDKNESLYDPNMVWESEVSVAFFGRRFGSSHN